MTIERPQHRTINIANCIHKTMQNVWNPRFNINITVSIWHSVKAVIVYKAQLKVCKSSFSIKISLPGRHFSGFITRSFLQNVHWNKQFKSFPFACKYQWTSCSNYWKSDWCCLFQQTFVGEDCVMSQKNICMGD